jgi:hypothetical protein
MDAFVPQNISVTLEPISWYLSTEKHQNFQFEKYIIMQKE